MWQVSHWESPPHVPSHKECAAKCNDANRSVCSYPPRLRRCVVGNENGDERSNSESTYMARVDDSHDDDPFAETCEDERDDCLRREAALKRELAQCKADLDDDSAPERPLCGYKTWDGNYYQKISGKTLAECEALCLAEDRCLSYSANSLTTGYIQNCYLYEKVTRDAPHTDYPSWVQYKACHKNEA